MFNTDGIDTCTVVFRPYYAHFEMMPTAASFANIRLLTIVFQNTREILRGSAKTSSVI
jgi:hypothetical protein